MGVGTMVGGWRIIRTMGMRSTHLKPVNGFAAETGAATDHRDRRPARHPGLDDARISSAIMGVGATKRLSAVRWGVAGEVVAAWILTWPSCMVLGYVLAQLFAFAE